MTDRKATLTIDGEAPIELPILTGTRGQDVIDIGTLGSHGFFTYDPGFSATASCQSDITYIDGDKGILLHRGYPIEYVPTRHKVEYKGKIKRKVLVQADLWDGDPDIDAICRLSKKPIVKFKHFEPFTTYQLTPFNSQNTFLHRSVLKYYSVFPYTGRMDDIWGAYVMQYHFPNSVLFNKATVYQARNPQDLVKNLENEVIGYRNTLNLLNNLKDYMSLLPEKTVEYFNIYQKYFN
mgnify:CR=1 FL=1